MKGRTLYILILLIMAAGKICHAQERITFLDWDIIARDTICPVYAEVVPLQTDYRGNTYAVCLEYPVWAPLTPREMTLAQRHSHKISDSIEINQYISIGRGEGMLNYSFIPIVRQDESYRKLISAQISIVPIPHPQRTRIEAEAATSTRTATTTERYARQSVLATGTWRKIHISKDGIYRLTASFLSSMGFQNPDEVHLYGYGGHQQSEALDADKDFDDLEEVPLYTAPNGDLLFWGNGLLHWEGDNRIFNAYATKATYFLTEGEARSEIHTEAPYTGTVTQNVNTTTGHALHEVDDYAWFRGGRNLVESYVFSGEQSRKYSFQDINSIGDERLTVVFTGGDVITPLTITVNGETVTRTYVPAAKSSNHDYYSEGKFADINVASLKTDDGTWRITLATKGTGTTNSRVQGRLDYIALNYTAPLVLKDGFVRFGNQKSGATRFYSIGTDGSTDIRVMRIGRRGKPATLLSTTTGEVGWECSVADGAEAFVAFDPTYAFPTPTAGESIGNQNLHALDSVDMVIIVPASGKLDAQAQRLADAHLQYDSLRCLVVRADHIYNEFSSGTPDATAYRRFLKMLYDRGLASGTAPRFLLLMGDCAWDNRMKSTAWRSYSPSNYLLCYQSENSYSDTKSYCWEDYFGLLDDGEGLAPFRDVSDLGIGRFPVTTEAEAKIMVDKTIAHMRRDNIGEWCNRIIMMGDDGDNNTHMNEANTVATRIEEVAPDADVRKVMWDNYTMVNQGLYNSYPEIEAYVEKQIQEGAMMFNYTGHGATYLLSHERVITLNKVKSWNTSRPPLWYVAACVVAPFDSQEDNIGEASVLNPGGAVAFIGTLRTVYSTPNLYLNRYFSGYLLGNNAQGRHNSVGEALRLAKGSMVTTGGDSGQPQNKLQYALLGDPALRFGDNQAKIVLDSINGESLAEGQNISGGSKVRLSGHVELTQGTVCETFNGILNYRLYDALENITTLGNTVQTSGPFKYTYRSKEINHGTDSVRSGRFSTTIIIPKDISYSNESGRLVFYAINNDKTMEANGSNEDFLVGGYDSGKISDSKGPEMFIYLNDKNFVYGDAVPNKPVFVAELKDESGIQYNGNGIGHDLQLCIDGNPDMTYNLNGYYTETVGDYTQGTVIYNDMPELSAGAHSLTFRAWDMFNNTSMQTLNFVIGEDLNAEVLSLILESDIISGHTNFHITYNYPNLECNFRLDIYAPTGALVWSSEVNTASDSGKFTIPWDGRNGDGASVADGIYICRVTASYKDGKKCHKEKKFIVRSNK